MNWWRHVVGMELRKILAYRSDFWITFLGQTFVQLLVAQALWQAIFASQGVTQMKGYTLEMMGLYYLIVPIGTRILTGENIGFVAREIYEGTFTRYLLYPLSVFQYKTLTYLTYSLFYGFQLVILYSLYRMLISNEFFLLVDLGHLFLGVAIFIIAAMVYVMMALMIELLALWADNIWSLSVMLRFFVSFFGGGFIPLDFLPAWGTTILKYTPFPYLISLPTRTIMGLIDVNEIVTGIFILIIWFIIFLGIVKCIWFVGQKKYSGVGI